MRLACRRSWVARFRPEEHVAGRADVILLSYGAWQRRFAGDPAVVGRRIQLEGRPHVIVRRVVDRTREIGVRMALGASPSAILRLFIAQGGWPVLVGVVVGMGLSFIAARLMASLLLGVTPTAPHTFLLVASLLLVVSLIAMALPARRAARVDPLVALRCE